MTHDVLRLESCALHTEEPQWAARMPEQVTAAFKRGAHVIGFTEVTRGHVADTIRKLAEQFGYTLIHGDGDTAIAIQTHFKIKHAEGFVRVAGQRGYSVVRFLFHGSDVTVFCQHWGTNKPGHQDTRVAQTHELIRQLEAASKGKRLAFFLGDCNPDGKLKDPNTFPRKELDAAGMVMIYEELKSWPRHVGVNAMGHPRRDTRAVAVAVDEHPARGSDHYPIVGQWRIKRLERKPAPATA